MKPSPSLLKFSSKLGDRLKKSLIETAAVSRGRCGSARKERRENEEEAMQRSRLVVKSAGALVLLALLVASVATAAPSESKKGEGAYGKVKWMEPDETMMEKAARVSKVLKGHLEATGQTLGSMLKENGVDVQKALGAVGSKIKGLFGGGKDTRDLAEKLQDAAAKLQKSLEENLYPKIKEMGEAMIQKGEPEEQKPKESTKKKKKKQLNKEELGEIMSNMAGGEAIAKLSQDLQEGLMNVLDKVNPGAEDVKAQLSKAKEGVHQISAWADELYKNGVPVEKIKELLTKAGLNAVEEEGNQEAAASHEEL